tara:strand:- start:3702 stop:4403 length:702 start_codon:yes stop_codon:yes gene_type:complete
MEKLTIAMPVYNEEKNIEEIVNRVKKVKFPMKVELIIVDDFSSDGTKEKIKRIKDTNGFEIKKFYHKKNLGKGGAIRTAIDNCSGDLFVIQDADLEYNPEEILKLIELRKEGIVYGSRLLGKNKYSYLSYLAGNILLNLVTNVLYLRKLTDMETCYKMIPGKVIRKIDLEARGFDMEPEITAKVSLLGYKIKEVPISYNARSKEEGKKIKWTDGVVAIWTLLYWRFKGFSTQT